MSTFSSDARESSNPPIVIALPKGRILEELLPVLEKAGITLEDNFFDKSCRELSFSTNLDNLRVIRVRSFDVATFVSYGAAHMGICGSDVMDEFNYPDIYAPIDLDIGRCRLSMAALQGHDHSQPLSKQSHVKVATKYPHLASQFLASKGVQAECIKLNGAIELAPQMGLCEYIVDLVGTGTTLKVNGMEEVESVMEVSSRLIVSRTAYKTRSAEVQSLIERFRQVV